MRYEGDGIEVASASGRKAARGGVLPAPSSPRRKMVSPTRTICASRAPSSSVAAASASSISRLMMLSSCRGPDGERARRVDAGSRATPYPTPLLTRFSPHSPAHIDASSTSSALYVPIGSFAPGRAPRRPPPAAPPAVGELELVWAGVPPPPAACAAAALAGAGRAEHVERRWLITAYLNSSPSAAYAAHAAQPSTRAQRRRRPAVARGEAEGVALHPPRLRRQLGARLVVPRGGGARRGLLGGAPRSGTTDADARGDGRAAAARRGRVRARRHQRAVLRRFGPMPQTACSSAVDAGSGGRARRASGCGR